MVTVAVSSFGSPSSAAVAVTVCVVLQSVLVKVKEVSESVTSVLLLPSVTVTSPVGLVVRRTVKVLVEPSPTVSVTGETVMPGESFSLTVTATVALEALP